MFVYPKEDQAWQLSSNTQVFITIRAVNCSPCPLGRTRINCFNLQQNQNIQVRYHKRAFQGYQWIFKQAWQMPVKLWSSSVTEDTCHQDRTGLIPVSMSCDTFKGVLVTSTRLVHHQWSKDTHLLQDREESYMIPFCALLPFPKK